MTDSVIAVVPEALPPAELEVELASPWLRVGAVILNQLILYAVCLLYLFTPTGSSVVGMLLIVLLLIGLAVWQCVWMSKRGQSIGKRIVGIRVLGLDGCNPGFLGIVLLREVVYTVICLIFVFSAIMLLSSVLLPAGVSPWHPAGLLKVPVSTINIFNAATRVINALPGFICFCMLFRKSSLRRTLQDYLAKTIVVKASAPADEEKSNSRIAC